MLLYLPTDYLDLLLINCTMNKLKLVLVLLLSFQWMAAQENPLTSGNFWKSNPDVARVKAVMAKGHSLKAKGGHGMDVLNYALAGGASVPVVEYLVKEGGFELNKKVAWQPPVFFAAASGNFDLVKYLIEKGADAKALSRGRSLFLAMVEGGNIDDKVFHFFEQKGINLKYDTDRYGRSALLLAAQKMKNASDLAIFEKYGFDFNGTDTMGNGLFFYASRSGNIALLKHLVKEGYYYGVNPNSGDNVFTFATQRARGVKPVNLKTLTYLKSLGLNPAQVNKKGSNALLNMVFSVKDPKVWQFFIDNGADANLENRRGIPLIAASYRGTPEVLAVLLSKTKDINARNKSGVSAIIYAVRSNTPVAVKFLLENGADVKAADNKGHDLGGYLVTNYRRNIDQVKKKMEVIKSYGYDSRYRQPDGSTLLHLAAKKNKPELVDFVLSLKGIKINTKDNNGYTALHKAAMTAKDLKTLKLLVKKRARKRIKTELGETAYDLAMENELLEKYQKELKFLK